MMLILLSTIFIVPSGFIMVHSRALPIFYEESQQLTSGVVNSASGNTDQEELHRLPFKVSATGLPVKARKFPVYLDRQDMIVKKRHRRNVQICSEKDHQKKDVFANLFKVSNIRVADKNSINAVRPLKKTKLVDVLRRKFTLRNNSNSAGNITVTSSNKSFQISPNNTSNRASNNRNKQRYIRCQVIGDIYITDLNENVPSYACKLGNNTFFLSSKRFSRGYFNSLNVYVDDDTLRKLNNDSFASTESIQRIIEVILALKFDGINYKVHHQRTEL